MVDEILKRDQNNVTVLAGVTDDSNQYISMLRVDPVTKRLLISATVTTTANIIVGTSTITGGTNGYILYNNNGVVGNLQNNFLTSLAGAVLTDQTVGQTIGATGARLTKLWAVDITCTNAIVASITGSAPTLTTARAIYGNNFDGSAALTQVIASTYGGTGNGFTKFTGPTTSEKTFTLPDASTTLVGTTDTQTLTNKRITPRVGTQTNSSQTPTINTDNVDMFSITGQTADITSFTTNLSGTPTSGQKLVIQITGTAARALTWGTGFEASTVALPTTTVTTAMLSVGFIYNSATSKWTCVAVA